jgi:hypothetical protein
MAEELELTFTEDAQRDGSTSGQTVMTEDAAA